ncbi:MAG: hypothetical protein K0B15_11305 [Lentimicrobium sp.]|nr:hypothetical protein [Lentimicrobium sp.]
MSGFKPFMLIFAVLLAVAFLLKIVMPAIMYDIADSEIKQGREEQNHYPALFFNEI